jgi:diguanylate cyclase (GGDEF)-like protein
MNILRALNVEDDDVDRESFRRLTAKLVQPIKLDEASSFAEGKEMLKSTQYDCVFLDYNLGDASGLDMIPLIVQHRAEICPIIMISTSGSESLVVEALRKGVYDYITKSSLNTEQLEHAIASSLNWAERETELRNARERMQHLSLYDSLTDLPNRTLLFDRLEHQIRMSDRNGEAFVLMMLDVNGFKEVNDTLGHDAGDSVLRIIAHRLAATVRTCDTMARLGGDEFACVLPLLDCSETATPEIAMHIAEKIVAAVHAPINVDNETVTVGISIGIAQFPLHGRDSRSLLKRADQAMYQAKQGSSGLQVFSPDFNLTECHSVLLAGSLERAVANGEMRVHFQPQVDLCTGEIVGKEALVRWQSPEQGMIMPDKFIPAAERSTAIISLTYAVLRMALDEEHSWRASGLSVPVSVNISARILDDRALPARILEMLNERNLPPECLILELTETALFSAPALARTTLCEMSEAGLRLSIDDFGSGYTSFKQLRDLEVAEIKIDGLYIRNVTATGRDASIVRSIVELGHGFDIQVIAECVERKESWQILQDLGCLSAQGYSIGKPMARADFDYWIDRWPLFYGSPC